MSPPFASLGGEPGLVAAVKECKRIGVNVVPFLSVILADAETAPRYGLTVSPTGGWTYHTEMIPKFNPPYAHAYACVSTAPYPTDPPRTNSSFIQKWCDDVLEGTHHRRRDVARPGPHGDPQGQWIRHGCHERGCVDDEVSE